MSEITNYFLKDTNSQINIIYSSVHLHFVINELLSNIDNHLGIFISNGIKLPPNKLNFDNFEILVTINTNHNLPLHQSTHPLIIEVYKFNLQKLSFYDMKNNEIDLMTSDQKFILASISKKLNLIVDGKISNQVNNNGLIVKSRLIQQKEENPIKKIFEETHGLIKKIENNKSDNKTRLIPTIKSSNESESDTSKESESESDNENDNILNDVVCLTDKKIEPDIPRQMDSVLIEAENGGSLDITVLGETIEILKELKKLEKDKLEQLQSANDDDMENFSKFCNNLGDKRRELRKNMERETGRRNRFEANKEAYRKMKQHIADGKLTEDKISELFIDEYPIYKFMDEKSLLDTSDDYITFLNIYNELYNKNEPENSENSENKNKAYVPHNINYLNEEEQEKYKHVQENNTDLISEFVNNHKKPKKYPSLEEVLDAIDSTEDIEDCGKDCDNFDGVNFELNN